MRFIRLYILIQIQKATIADISGVFATKSEDPEKVRQEHQQIVDDLKAGLVEPGHIIPIGYEVEPEKEEKLRPNFLRSGG